MTHLGISRTISAIGLKLCRLSHKYSIELLSKKIGKLISTFWWRHHMFDWFFTGLPYVISFFSRFDKTFDWKTLHIWNRPKTSQRIEIQLRKFQGCGWYRESQKKSKVGVAYSLSYGMGLNTIVSRLQVFSRKNSNKQQVK